MNFHRRVKGLFLPGPLTDKILLIMKLVVLFTFAAILQATANSHAQQITLKARQIALSAAMDEIHAQTGYQILLSGKNLGRARVDVNLENASLNETMKTLLNGLPLRWIIRENTIIIKPDDGVQTKRAKPGGRAIQEEITGTVRDASGTPLEGVTVAINGGTTATITNSNGGYRLVVTNRNVSLVFSIVGYETREIALGTSDVLDVTLQERISDLEEVVVVGYGTQNAEEVTGSVASVKSEDFNKGTVNDIAQLVQGKIAGLNVVTADANPNSASQINLRGITTLMASAEPLILIDGVPGNLRDVSPQEIASVDVLKDGSAAAIYGTRGSNGVILITTKGAEGDLSPTIEINSYVNTQVLARKLDFMDAVQYRRLIQDGVISEAFDKGADTRWIDEVMETPVSYSNDISLRGGNTSTNYIVSLRYAKLSGILRRSDNQQIQPRLHLNHTMFDKMLKINANINGYVDDHFVGQNVGDYNPQIYLNALHYNPTAPVRMSDGLFYEDPGFTAGTDWRNPVALIQEVDGAYKGMKWRINGSAVLEPIAGLSLRALGSRTYLYGMQGYYETKQHISNIQNGLNGFASKRTSRTQEDLFELTAEYKHAFQNRHHLRILGGYGWNFSNYQDDFMENFDFPSDDYSYNNMGSGAALQDGRATMGSLQNEHKLVSYFSRLNYNFDNRYLLSASIRFEGSSKFGANEKWAKFPAFSLGWNIHRESFFSDLNNVSSLRLRFGYGTTGIVPTEPYMSLSRLNFDNWAFSGGDWIQTVNPETNPNPDLKWEIKEEVNLGLDFGLFNNRISGAIDLYNRRTKDMLWNYTVPTPPYLYNTIVANAASMENKGVEVHLNLDVIQAANFNWNTTLNFSTNKNKVLSLSSDKFQLEGGFFDTGSTGSPIQTTTHRVQIGQAIGNFFGYEAVGIDEDGRWLIEGQDGQPKPIAQQQTTDKKVIGNGLPKHNLSWNNSFRYRKLSMDIQMRGAFGFQILNVPRMYYEPPVGISRGNILTTAYHDVFGERPLSNSQELQYVDYYVENGDYWKVSNVTLGYDFGLNIPYLDYARIYASASNVLTISGYKGVDPEVNITGLNPGVDNRSGYPHTRTYTAGIQLIFKK